MSLKSFAGRLAGAFRADDLAFDLVIAASPALLFPALFPVAGRFIDHFTPTGLMALCLAVSFVAVLFMGAVYRRFLGHTDSGFVKGLLRFVFFLGISAAYLVPILAFAALRIDPLPVLGRDGTWPFLLLPAYPIFWGIFLGFPDDQRDEALYTLFIPGVMALIGIPLTALVIGSQAGLPAGLITLPLLVVLLLLPAFVRLRLAAKREKARQAQVRAGVREGEQPGDTVRRVEASGAFRPGRLAAVASTVYGRLLLPAAAALAFLVWQALLLEVLRQAYANWKMPADSDFLFVSLFISGIVPLRLVAFFAPPWRPLGIVAAAAAFWFYISGLYTVVFRAG